MTDTTTYIPWELSPSYDEHYRDARQHVVDVLDEWGGIRYNSWPEKARFVSISEAELTNAWFQQIVHLGRAGVQHMVDAKVLVRLFPNLTWSPYSHDVYFIEPSRGNVRKMRAKELHAYIPMHEGNRVRIVHLGCDHPNVTVTKQGNSYREYVCPACEFTWGVDSSG